MYRKFYNSEKGRWEKYHALTVVVAWYIAGLIVIVPFGLVAMMFNPSPLLLAQQLTSFWFLGSPVAACLDFYIRGEKIDG